MQNICKNYLLRIFMFGTFGLQNVPEFSLRFKMHGCGIYAKPLSGRSRTVCKQMAEV